MGSDREFMFHNLINEQIDEMGKRLLRLCSIPSFFTHDLVVSCLSALSTDPVCDAWIHHFLSLPFISKRTSGTGDSKMEYYMIHQLVREAIPLSAQDYRTYGSILEQYFDEMCTNASPYMEKFFYEKLHCELMMGEFEPWRQTYQAAMEMNRLQECNKLISLLRASKRKIPGNWYCYYRLVNRYINSEPTQEILSDLEALLRAAKSTECEYICYLRLFLGVLYDTVGRWQDAQSLYTEVLGTPQDRMPVNQDILPAAYVSLTTVNCHLNDFSRLTSDADSMLASIDHMNLGLKIAAYKAAGLWSQKVYQWDQTYEMYKYALQNMERLQHSASLPLAQVYRSYRPCPLYRSDEVGIYNRLGEILLLKGDFHSALEYHQKELRAQKLSQNKVGIAWAAYNIGRTQYLLGDTAAAKDMFYESIRIFNGTENKMKCAYPLGELSYVFQYVGQPERSFQCLEESVNMLLRSEDIEKCLFYFNHLGRICQAQGFLSFAARIFELCLQYYKSRSKTDNIGWVYNNYARNYMFSGDYLNAEIYFRCAQEIFTQRYDKRGLAYVCNNIAELSVKISRTLEAEELFKKSLSMKEAMGDQHAVCYTYRELGELYLFLNDLEKAEANLAKADKLCRQANYLMLQGDIDLSYGKLMRQKKRYKSAMEHFEHAAANYNKQNFLTRMINCFQIESEAAEQAADQSLSHKLRRAMANIERRRKEEEFLMMDRIKPLMQRIETFIAINR